ncbi:MAG: sugar kinase, partial [Microbacteriaceae bacterium]|nr:sugar kinase [Microbacteriaceae bacterium]
RLGRDGLGRRVLAQLHAAGVDVACAEMVEAPTGVFFKDPGERSTEVLYYRQGSAGSQLDTSFLDRIIGSRASVVHVSGVTPALGDGPRDLVRRILCERLLGSGLVSFDVNYRGKLWPVADAAEVLLDFARESEIVFVGLDEARTLWGCGSADEVRGLIRAPRFLVVKDDSRIATEFEGAAITIARAPRVDVVERVGAGDAFAAGWMAALSKGIGGVGRLRVGHATAREVLKVSTDHAPLDTVVDLIASLDGA